MTLIPDEDSPALLFEPEAFLVPPMDGFLRRLFGARWGIILVSSPLDIPLEPVMDFLADYSLQMAYYSEFSVEIHDFNRLQPEERRIRTLEDVLNEAKSATESGEPPSGAPTSGEHSVRHVPRNPELVFVPRFDSPDEVREIVEATLRGSLVVAGITAEGSFPALKAFRAMVGSNHLVAASLMGIIGLNAVGWICPECKVAVEYDLEDQDAYLLGVEDPTLRGFKGLGCEKCGDTGFISRVMIREGLEISEKLRTSILNETPLRRLRLEAKHEGMVTLLDGAWSLQKAGETTIDEVVRIADVTDPGPEGDTCDPGWES